MCPNCHRKNNIRDSMCLTCGGLRYPDDSAKFNQNGGPPDNQSLHHYPNIQNRGRGRGITVQNPQQNRAGFRGSGARGGSGRGSLDARPDMMNSYNQRGFNHRGSSAGGRGRGITVAPQHNIDFQGDVLAMLSDQSAILHDQSEKLDKIVHM